MIDSEFLDVGTPVNALPATPAMELPSAGTTLPTYTTNTAETEEERELRELEMSMA